MHLFRLYSALKAYILHQMKAKLILNEALSDYIHLRKSYLGPQIDVLPHTDQIFTSSWALIGSVKQLRVTVCDFLS